jgi:S1-C subfamily serine protease
VQHKFIALALVLLTACTGCVAQQPVGAAQPSQPSQVDTVAYAIRHTLLLDPPGCTGVEIGDGLVVTAKHCLDDGAVVGNPFGAPDEAGEIAFISFRHDFAVIKYPRLPSPQTMIHMRPYVVGEHVYIVGYPLQLRSREQELTVTDGLMAGPVDDEGAARTTAEAYFGNSGGGVWGEDGALLGILVSINASPGLGGPMPYPAQSYMVPVKYILPVL